MGARARVGPSLPLYTPGNQQPKKPLPSRRGTTSTMQVNTVMHPGGAAAQSRLLPKISR